MKIYIQVLSFLSIYLINNVNSFCLPEYMKGYALNIRSSIAPILKSNNLSLTEFSITPNFNLKLESPDNTSIIHSSIIGIGTIPCKNILFNSQYLEKFKLPDAQELDSLGLWLEKKNDHDFLINFCPY